MSSTTASSPPGSSGPGTLSNALSWTFQRWNSASSSRSQPTAWGGNFHRNLHEGSNERNNSSSNLSLSTPSSRPASRRRASPFQPPPLPPLVLDGYSPTTETRLLTPLLAEEIRQLIPPRLQLYDTWSIVYSLEQHGVSLTTLYERCSRKEFQRGGFVLVVKDDGGGLFGAFVNERLRVSGGRYYGTGECFLWKATWVKNYRDTHAQSQLHHRTHPRHHYEEKVGKVAEYSEGKTEEEAEEPSRVSTAGQIAQITKEEETVLKFKAFPYSGINEYMILCEQTFLSIGGGDGKYGLWLDDNFEKGVSSPCLTFGNETLSDDGEKFDIIGVEVWSIGGAML